MNKVEHVWGQGWSPVGRGAGLGPLIVGTFCEQTDITENITFANPLACCSTRIMCLSLCCDCINLIVDTALSEK